MLSLSLLCLSLYADPRLFHIVDVKDIKFVINFDYPNNSEDYVHRIGRTARGGDTGTSYTFFTTKNAKQSRDLIKVLREAKQEVPRQLEEMSMYSGGGKFHPLVSLQWQS